jgi:hypothetical protein
VRCFVVDSVGLYVDVENLMDVAKEAITRVFEQWPEELQRPSMLRLYVRADQVELWRFWAAERRFSPDIQVVGVQHHTLKGSKNSADLALALDAITDLLKGKTTYAAILSDDSDFATLFIKISKEVPRLDSGKFPFIWFMTDRPNTRSPILDEFIPADYVRTVICSVKKSVISHRKNKLTPEHKENQDVLIAQTIVQNIPIGNFKSTDCVKLIRQYFPKHSLAKLDSASFGTQFVKTLWPILEGYGVQVTNTSRRPRRYEMTEEAKRKGQATT